MKDYRPLTGKMKAGLAALALWELGWKGVALWKSARRSQPGWFVAILLINSAGVLPITYLLMNSEAPDAAGDRHGNDGADGAEK